MSWFRPRHPVPTGSFALREESGLTTLRARGAVETLSEVLLLHLRSLPGPFGLVLSTTQPPLREWSAPLLGRAVVLEALMRIRDRLGVSGLDLGVHSEREGLELSLDRFGTLEGRSLPGGLEGLGDELEGRGFDRVERVPVLPQEPQEVLDWTEDAEARLGWVVEHLGCFEELD